MIFVFYCCRHRMVSIYFPIRQYDNILGDSLNLLESCTLSQSALSRVTLVLQDNAEHTVQSVHNEQYNYNFKDEHADWMFSVLDYTKKQVSRVDCFHPEITVMEPKAAWNSRKNTEKLTDCTA